VAGLAGAIVLLLIGSVAGIARANETSVALRAGSDAARQTPQATDDPSDLDLALAPVDLSVTVTAPPPPTTTVATAPATPTTPASKGPTTTAPGPARASGTSDRPAGGNHTDRPRGPDQVGSADDLGPGPVEPTVPAPCTPSSQTTATHSIAVAELALGCVRALVPSDVWVRRNISWNPEATWLVAVVEGRIVRLARDGSWRQDLGGGGQVYRADLSPDGRRMIVLGHAWDSSGEERPLALVTAADGTGGRPLEGSFLQTPAWSPDSQFVALTSNGDGAGWTNTVHVFGLDGRELARRTFADRSLWGTPPPGGSGPMTFRPGPAPLGPPSFLSDGRLFLPAFIELPARLTGLWFDRSLREVEGPGSPGDLLYPDGASGPSDGSALIYTGYSVDEPGSGLVRRLDLRTGTVTTLARDAAYPSSAHRSRAVAFIPRDAAGRPQGLSVVDGSGVVRQVWRGSGTDCTCVSSWRPAWTPQDDAVAVVGKSG